MGTRRIHLTEITTERTESQREAVAYETQHPGLVVTSGDLGDVEEFF